MAGQRKLSPEGKELIENLLSRYNPADAKRQIRKVTKTRTIFPFDDALFKLHYLATMDITEKWTGRDKDRNKLLPQLCICFEDRIDPEDLE